MNIQSLWLDELYTVLISSNSSYLWKYLVTDNHPPLYALFMSYWFKIFGTSEISARFPSAIAGVLSLLTMYHYSKQFFDKYISTSATILLSLTYTGIYYSQEARSYSFLILSSIISIFWFMKILSNESPSFKDYTIYSIISILTAYIHYFGLLLIIFQFIYLFLITAIFNKQKLSNIVVIQFLLLIAYIPWINVMIDTLKYKGGGNFWIQKPGLDFFLSYVYTVTYPIRNIFIIFSFLMILPLALDFKKFTTSLLAHLKVMNLKSPIFVLVYLAISTSMTSFIISQHTPILIPRNLLIISPIVYLIISVWISMCSKLSAYKQNAYILTICIVCFALASPYYYSPQKEQWREATDYAVNNSDNQTMFVIQDYAGDDFGIYNYYFNKTEVPKNAFRIICTEDKFNLKQIYSQMIALDKNKMIIICVGEKLTKNGQDFLESKSTSHEVKKFVHAVVYVYRFN